MTPSAIWPSELPQVQLSDKQGQATDPQVRTPLASGRTRTRLAFEAVPVDWNFSLVCTDDQALTLENFYAETLRQGTLWFAMELDLPQGRGPWPFQFIGALPVPTRIGSPDQGLWRYSGIRMQQWLRPDAVPPGPGPEPDPEPEILYTMTGVAFTNYTNQGFTFRVNDALRTSGFSLRDGDIFQVVAPTGRVWDSPSHFEHTDPVIGNMQLNLSYSSNSNVSRVTMTGAGATGMQPWDNFVMGDYIETPGPSLDFIAAALDAINGEVIT